MAWVATLTYTNDRLPSYIIIIITSTVYIFFKNFQHVLYKFYL